jgi:hypothetical protein
MATSIGESTRQPVALDGVNGIHLQGDPFAMETPPTHPHPHRFSSYDTQLFSLNHPSSSPAQAKRALEAHLAETDRRIQETSKLGTTLVQQRQNLSLRLRDVGSQDEEGEISPELRQKLIEIEKEYNEVGRQSARAFLGPKANTQGDGSDAPFALDGRVRCSFPSTQVSLIGILRIMQVLQNFPARLRTHPQRSMSREDSGTRLLKPMTLSLQPRSQLRFSDRLGICKGCFRNVMKHLKLSILKNRS